MRQHPAINPALRVILGFLALVTLAVGGVLTWLWSEYSISSWKTWGFRISHKVLVAQQHRLGARTVHFVLKTGEDPAGAVRACIHAFESELNYDSVESNCIAFRSVEDAQRQAQTQDLKCEVARATQFAYGSAAQAEVKVNRDRPCEGVV